MGLIRGTTPTIILNVNNPEFDMDNITECHVTMVNSSGRNKKIFENCTWDSATHTITFTMTEEDTLSFEKGYLFVQVKLKLSDGQVLSHPIITTTMDDILEEGTFTTEEEPNG